MFLKDRKEIDFGQRDDKSYKDPDAQWVMNGTEPKGYLSVSALLAMIKKRPFTLKYPPNLDKYDPLNPHMRIKPKGKFPQLTEFRINPETGRKERWTYFETIREEPGTDKKTYVMENGKRHYTFNGSDIFHEDRVELLWFLINLSTKKGRFFVVEDREEEARGLSLTRKQEGHLIQMIYDDLNDEDLRIVAKGYDIANIDNFTTEEIQNILYDKAKEVGYDIFKQNRTANKFMVLRAAIRDAKDMKLLGFNPAEKNRTWYFISIVNGDTVYEKSLFTQRQSQPDMEALKDYFLDNEKERKELEKLVLENSKGRTIQSNASDIKRNNYLNEEEKEEHNKGINSQIDVLKKEITDNPDMHKMKLKSINDKIERLEKQLK
jgi:hypothetical protein